ncbi:MAG: histidine kinase dimerization/phosphoacceptor domain -containing protein [Spirochaetaceae bacterium]
MKNILVVDNNPLMLEFMRELLTPRGYSVRTSQNGLEALHMVEELAPDVMFIDLVMPQIDGKELSKILRTKPQLENLLIVIVSGIAVECGKDKDFTLADAYIAKSPFKRMKGYILQVLEDFEKGVVEPYKEKALGCDDLFKREITSELLYSKHHLELLLYNMDVGFVEMTKEGEIIFANPSACSLVNVEYTTLITTHFPDIFSDKDSLRIQETVSRLESDPIIEGEEQPFVLHARKLLLHFIPISYSGYEAVSVVLQDITKRKEAEELIKSSLHKKETLLKEVHHRVKNNLSVIASLLNLQSSYIDNEDVKKHLIDSRNRVESMALVHDRLYISEDLSGIDLHSYIEGIVQQLLDVYLTSDTSIGYSVHSAPVTVTMELAVPIGLIVNELISNSLEHAFWGYEGEEKGKIEVSITEQEEFLTILVSDNGVGLPEGFDLQADESETLGLVLSHTLAEQIHGTLSIENAEKGVHAAVDIPLAKWKDKIL